MIIVVEAALALLFSPPTKREEEAFKAPATCRPAPIELEALAMKPPCRLARPVASKVLETVVAPLTLKVPPILEEEFWTISPPCRVARPVARRVLNTVVAPEIETVPPKEEEELLTISPAFRVVSPPRTVAPLACRVPLAFKAPATWRPAETVLEAWEIKPAGKVARPVNVETPATDRKSVV